MEYPFCVLKPEIIIGISSIFIASMALIATIWQASSSHKHNKLSVRPYICQNPHFIDRDVCKLTISITNKGLGTAVIKGFTIHFNDNVITNNNLRNTIGKITTKDFNVIQGSLSQENALSKDETLILLEIEKESASTIENSIFNEIVEQLRGKVHYSILYESIYGVQQCMTCKFE